MIGKSLSVPACTRYTLEFPLSKLKAGGKIKRVRLSHMKEEGGALVCAEGMTLKCNAGRVISSLFCSALEASYFSAPSSLFHTLDTRYTHYIMDPVRRVIDCYNKNGTRVLCVLSLGNLYRIQSSSSYSYIANYGGTCAAVHYERLYFAKFKRLYYSAPMVFDSLTLNTTYGGGYLDFVDAAGDILELVSLKDKLYLFRERGITAVTAFGDPLNFKTAALPYTCGTIISGSVAGCGDKVYFFTERGLHVFDGSSCKKVENADEDEIDLTAEIHGAGCRGKYYAAAKKRDATSVFYSYDGDVGRGRYINHECGLLAANDKIYFSSDNVIYELSGKALPASGECALEVGFTLGDYKAGEKFAESVCVAGTGGITLSLVSDCGGKASARGECGTLIRLPHALRGNTFELTVTPDDADFEIRSVSVNVRRDEA